MTARFATLRWTGLAFAAGVAATLASTQLVGRAPRDVERAVDRTASVSKPTSDVPRANPSCVADDARERPGCAVPAGTDAADEERRRAEIRDDVAMAERDLAEEVAAGRAAAEGAPSEAAALGQAVASRTASAVPDESPAALVPARVPAPVSVPQARPEPPRPVKVVRPAEPIRRRPVETAARASRSVASAEGGVMRWLNTPGAF